MDPKTRSFRIIHTLFTLLTVAVVQVHSQLTWNNCLDVVSDKISVYTGTNLVNSFTASPVFNVAFTAVTSGSALGAIGFTTFQVPPTRDYSIITNTSVTPSTLQLTVSLMDNTVVLLLDVDYIVMATNSDIFHMAISQFYPPKMNQSVGYRSDYDIILRPMSVSPIYASKTVQSLVVLQGFRIINDNGSHIYIDSVVHFPASGVINTTFITFEECQVYYVKYAVLLFDPVAADIASELIFRTGWVIFNSNNTIASDFFSNLLPRYQVSSRMFFGLGSFNFTKAYDKTFRIDTSNYASMYSTYIFGNVTHVKLNYYFFVQRLCPLTTYFYYNYLDPTLDTCTASCSAYTDKPTDDLTYLKCQVCHPSCLTCSASHIAGCLTCNASNYRVIGTTPAPPTTCDCMPKYVSSGGAACNLCSTYITGCLTCSSQTTCTSCILGFIGTTSCSCPTGSIVSGYCNTVHGCITISQINSTQTCTSCNSLLLLELSAAFQCVCITGTTMLANLTCVPICGDNYVMPRPIEGCDDGNILDGDGCSINCTVQTNWSCVGVLAQGSTCKINVTVAIEYIGALRDTTKNEATLHYKLSPYFSQFKKVDFSSILSTSLPPGSTAFYGQTEDMLIVNVPYGYTLEGTHQSLQLLFNNTAYFWNVSTIATSRLRGVNAELTYDDNLWIHNTMIYIVYVLVALVGIVFLAGLFVEKWIGLQLVQTYQMCFFMLALEKGYPFEFTSLTEGLKYSNGFSLFYYRQYYRTYPMPDQLNALVIHKQFVKNYNLMYILVAVIIVISVLLGLLKWYSKQQIRNIGSKKELEQVSSAFSLVFSRFLLMFIFFSMLNVIFCFIVQLDYDKYVYTTISDKLCIGTSFVAFGLVTGSIFYVFYWYLLLPETYNQNQVFINLQFKEMRFSYPIIYLYYQSLLISIISILHRQRYTIYIVLSLQAAYLVLIVFYRPYNVPRRLNRYLHNTTIFFNQCICIFMAGVIAKWNSMDDLGTTLSSNSETRAYYFIILVLLIIALLLAIFRLMAFDKQARLRCWQQSREVDQMNSETAVLKNIEKQQYGSYLKETGQVEKGEFQTPSLLQKQTIKKEHSPHRDKLRLNLQKQDKTPENKEKKKQKQIEAGDKVLSNFLNEEYLHWNSKQLKFPYTPKNPHSNMMRSTAYRKGSQGLLGQQSQLGPLGQQSQLGPLGQLGPRGQQSQLGPLGQQSEHKKSSLQIYLQMKNKTSNHKGSLIVQENQRREI